MTGIPPQAITAAVASLSKHADTNRWLTAAEGTVGGLLARKELLTIALEAAAPFLAEDGWDAARDRITEANDARRDERERCAQLAESVSATYEEHEPCRWGSALCRGVLLNAHAHFADLLRKEATDDA